MSVALPRWPVPRSSFSDPAAWEWGRVQAFPRFVLADGSGPAVQQTRLRVCWDGEALYVRFDCEDRDAWGTYERRDDPVYEEEAVEVFLAPGEEDPTRYFEFEVSPLGTVFDARIHNPTSRRADMTADPSWDCPGLRWAAGRSRKRQDWWAVLAIPWAGLLSAVEELPKVWRANFYRIERPRNGAESEPELSAWSPTLTRPADFHKPARFGVLELAGASSSR
ncbi:MAG TPA: carbohydrate-binding family 9-like protein [Thermoanaerobaculia bacterium]|nr:carbohydrate-binding family 9-like protein [Thermoanaerobaculia bacterium]